MGCCSCIGGICLKIFMAIVSILKAACCIAIICIVALHLSHVTYTIPDSTGQLTNSSAYDVTISCQLGTDYDGNNLCTYAYVVCGISLAVSLGVAILLCCTCDLCGLGFLIEVILSCFGMLWWLAASLVFTANVKDANQQSDLPDEDQLDSWRNGVVVLSWATFGLFAVTFLIYLGKMLSAMCECCGCCKEEEKYKS